jgi:hypothetical protein
MLHGMFTVCICSQLTNIVKKETKLLKYRGGTDDTDYGGGGDGG